MMTLFGIKNCDTVKKARHWLDANAIAYDFFDLHTQPLSPSQVQTWVANLGLERLINKRSTTWKDLSAETKANLNEANAAQLIIAKPTLIKRPLLDTGTAQQVGFSADQYTQIFN
jgi:Spx/MgsR family transcriptional regulator